jgi:hypothetical protein
MIFFLLALGCDGSGIYCQVAEKFLEPGGMIFCQPVGGLVLRQGDDGFTVIGIAPVGGSGGIFGSRAARAVEKL